MLELSNFRSWIPSSTAPQIVLSKLPPTLFPLKKLIAYINGIPLPSRRNISGIRQAMKENGLGVASLLITADGEESPRLPIWIIGYWEELESLENDIKWWKRAQTHLRNDSDTNTLDLLATIPWDGRIPQEFGCRVWDMAGLATHEWLTGTQLDMLGQYVNCTLAPGRRIIPTINGQGLIHRYREGRPKDKFFTPAYLQRIGEDLRAGTLEQIGFCINVNLGNPSSLPSSGRIGNHWVSLVINVPEDSLYFGDSEEGAAPRELLSATRSWLKEYFAQDFISRELPPSKQPNSWCCGDMAISMIAQHLQGKLEPVVYSSNEIAGRRRYMLRQVVETIRMLVSYTLLVYLLSV